MKLLKFTLFTFAFMYAAAIFAQPVIDPTNPASIMEYWQFLYAAIMPIGNYLLSLFWKSNTKKDLTIKTSAFAIAVLVVIISFKGISLAIIWQALLAFIGQALMYDKVYNPAGLNSTAEYKQP